MNENNLYYLIPISAKTEEALERKLIDLSHWLEKNNDAIIGDIAYTLLIARNHFVYRTVFMVSDSKELKELLKIRINGDSSERIIYQTAGYTKKKPSISKIKEGNLLIDTMLDLWKNPDKFNNIVKEIAEYYVNGIALDWEKIYKYTNYRVISMPTYPFVKEKYWSTSDVKHERKSNTVFYDNYPMISKNQSDFFDVQYSTVFNKELFFVKDHIVGEDCILPGVVYLEMAREACSIALGGMKITGFRNIEFLNPVRFNSDEQELHIWLDVSDIGAMPDDSETNEIIDFKIYSQNKYETEIIHSKGNVILGSRAENEAKENEYLKIIENANEIIDSKECYKSFAKGGLNLGDSFRTIHKIYVKNNTAISQIRLPNKLEKEYSKYELHPSIMDGALETAISMLKNAQKQNDNIFLPGGMGEIMIYRQIPSVCYSMVEADKNASDDSEKIGFNVKVIDEEGNLCVQFRHFYLKKTSIQRNNNSSNDNVFYFEKAWQETELKKSEGPYNKKLVLFDDNEEMFDNAVKNQIINADSSILVKWGDTFRKVSSNHYEIDKRNEEDYQLLIAALADDGSFAYNLIYLFHEIVGNTDQKVKDSFLPLFNLFKFINVCEKINCVCAYLKPSNHSDYIGVESLNGFLKTVNSENKNINGKIVCFDEDKKDAFWSVLVSELEDHQCQVIHYENGKRFSLVNSVVENIEKNENAPQLSGKNYLITGGTGGIGTIFARYLASERCNVILCGRKEKNEYITKLLSELNSDKAKAAYYQVNVCNENGVLHLLEEVHNEFGAINGIIHCAGINRDSYIINKNINDALNVIQPKVAGAVNLDKITVNEPLDCFVMFSSVAAINGNAGQADYAYANCFLDLFAKYRNNMVSAGRRNGNTLSINWPLWKNGGMHVSKDREEYINTKLGINLLSDEIGIQAFIYGISNKKENFAVFSGDKEKIYSGLGISEPSKAVSSVKSEAVEDNLPIIQEMLVDSVAKVLKIDRKKIMINTDLGDYGISSVNLGELTDEINEKLGADMTPADFYSCTTINAYAKFLLQNYANEVERYCSSLDNQSETESKQEVKEDIVDIIQKAEPSKKKIRRHYSENLKTNDHQAIAIIGVDCRMPMADDLEEFWKNLIDGKDTIIEVPKGRWDVDAVSHENDNGVNKNVSRWGGFINDVDTFDSIFFGISPREATKMDPQQRIFMETVWKTIEDAGYRASHFSNSRMGLFVGVATDDYSDLTRESNNSIEAYSTMGLSHCILVNRISYFFNWSGPSEPVNTACSSSLVAIHRAVQSIRKGECDTAIAGGINVMVSPTLHISFSKGGMLSKDGHCKTFDKSADGYVRGEGSGAIFLKKLDDAVRDGDHIYAIIRGSAVNHGGHATSLTAPNPNAQCSVIKAAYKDADMDMSRVGYIEAHGTGTSLGDPVEINALKTAFVDLNDKCGIGTVKTNIGHLEAAAGIAGIIKATLALQRKTIPKIINFKELNPYIKLQKSNFYIVDKNTEWKNNADKNGDTVANVAGVSSFGFGGVNAHVVLEEYIPQNKENNHETDEKQVIVLSARTKNSLLRNADNLRKYISERKENNISLASIAYTLQVGREELSERISFVCINVEEFIKKLDNICAGINDDSIYYGSVQTNGVIVLKSDNGNDDSDDAKTQVLDPDTIARDFVDGKKILWDLLHKDHVPKRISLPTYSFEKERFWLTYNKKKEKTSSLATIIDENVSTLFEQKYLKVLTRKDLYLSNHVVFGDLLLPGVAYMEMVAEAGLLAGQQKVECIYDVVWVSPIILKKNENEKSIFISIKSVSDAYSFVIYSIENDKKIVHTQGKYSYNGNEKISVDFGNVIDRCSLVRNKYDCYHGLFKKIGFDYGEYFQVTQKLYGNENEIFAELELNDEFADTLGDYLLHPALFDGAIRAIAGRANIKNQILHVPYSAGKVHVYSRLTKKCYSYARIVEGVKKNTTENMTFNIYVFNENKELAIAIEDFMARPYRNREIRYYIPKWDRCQLDSLSSSEKDDSVYLILCNNVEQIREFSSVVEKKRLLRGIIQSNNYNEENDIIYLNCSNFEHIKKMFDVVETDTNKKLVIVNCLLLNKKADNSVSDNIDSGIYTVLALIESLIEKDIAAHIITLYTNNEASPYFEAIEGISRSIGSITNKISLALFKIESSVREDLNTVFEKIAHCKISNGDEIKIKEDGTYIRKIIKCAAQNGLGDGVIKEHGNYLLIGGTGKIGQALSLYLAEMYHANISLVGTRKLDNQINRQIGLIQKNGGKAQYFTADLSKYNECENIIEQVKKLFGDINGIINLAGKAVPERMDLATREMNEKVFLPKIYGTVNLDRATQNEKIDFFIMFSSVSAEIGDMGSGSYAVANTFMDRYALIRSELEKNGKRYGKTVSINWPLFKDGGMSLEDQQEFYIKYSGLELIDNPTAFRIIEDVLKINEPQIIPAIGNHSKIEKTLRVISKNDIDDKTVDLSVISDAKVNSDELYVKTQRYLAELIGRVSEKDADQINPNLGLDVAYGIDSMLINELNGILEKDFPNLPKTIFFEYQTLKELTDYFVENYEDTLSSMFGTNAKSITEDIHETEINKNNRFAVPVAKEETEDVEDIAIIGISGKYPKAHNIDEFWEVLKNGEDCIEEIPSSRWDKNKFFDSKKRGYNYSKWGGFIDDVDKFDSLFFNISPREADYIDPQERLFLETTWEAMEDAGYCTRTLSGTNTGVFVGVMWGSYQLFGAEESLKGNVMTTSTPFASMANRVSYCLNLSGPSFAVDTMCSSSLTALHLACESIRNNECEMAFVGGVNVTVHPDKYLFLCRQHFLSSDGRCRSFGDGGDGYVPGEGVGSVLLKPLKKALADNDHIYAVIKGSAINHGGKTNGYSVPNPKAQAAVINKAIKESNISPETISYVETHGTGTALGDPIEIRGLQKGLNFEKKKDKICVLGSVKSNIGHLEAAAGVAAITKVVLQMKYQTLVPSIHSDVLNSNIDFNETPFYVQRTLEKWNRKKTITEGVETELPLRAGVSSFGAGGSNVHIIMEEYCKRVPKTSKDYDKQIVVLSAKNWACLEKYVEKLNNFINNSIHMNIPIDIDDIAYTLQIGRDVFANRVAFVVSSVEELLEEISNWKGSSQKVFIKRFDYLDEKDAVYFAQEYKNANIDELVRKEQFEKIAELWVNGAEIDWECIHRSIPRKISLPTYPFAKVKHWYPKSQEKLMLENKAINPLVDKNSSTFYTEKFEKKLRTDEFFICDHVINGQMILPGVAYLEMVRAAAEEASNENVAVIKNATWIQTILMDTSEKDIIIILEPKEHSVHFSVSNAQNSSQVYFDGHLLLSSQVGENDISSGRHFELEQLRSEHKDVMKRQECYQGLYKRIGFEYGSTFQVTDEILIGESSVLAELTLPDTLLEGLDDFVLHPSLLDGAVRAIAALDKDCAETYIPFGVGAVSIYSRLKNHIYAYATVASEQVIKREQNIFNISIIDDDGNELVRIKDFTVRKYSNQISCVLLKPQWIEKQIKNNDIVDSDKIIICNAQIKRGIVAEFGKDSSVVSFNEVERVNDHIKLSGSKDIIFIFSRNNRADLANGFRENILLIKQIFKNIVSIEEKKQIRCLICSSEFSGITMPEIESMICFAKSVNQFSNSLEFGVLEADCGSDYGKLHKYINYELNSHPKINELNVRWQNGLRYERELVEVKETQNDSASIEFKKDGVYVITGGFGSIGIEIMKYLQKNFNAKIIALGRSAESKVSGKLKELRSNGGIVNYYQCDVSDKKSVDTVIDKLIDMCGHINGVLYLAGLMDTRKIIDVSDNEFNNILLPKTSGIINIDEATKSKELDFFMIFSSISSELGDMGAISYSAGNTFIDRYCSYRHEIGYKKIFAVDWPMWKNGGMQMDDDYNNFYSNYLGMQQIETKQGIDLITVLLGYKLPQIIAVFGNKKKIIRNFKVVEPKTDNIVTKPETSDNNRPDNKEDAALYNNTVKYLSKIISDITHTPVNQISAKEELMNYGIDSVVGQEILEVLDEKFEEIPRTLLFEVNDVSSLAEYFINNYEDKLKSMFKISASNIVPANESANKFVKEEKTKISRFIRKESETVYDTQNTDIAIIGIDGKYPMANDLYEFWDNLEKGRSCIIEIPKERWDYRKGFNPKKGIVGKYYSKWGGFIEGVDEFDPDFFKLTPKDAEYLDPQERLFLENAYHTFEDAGYTIDELSKYKVGVFVGVMYSQYQLLAAEETLKGNPITLGSSYASIANRVSYYFNLKGPSIAIDTMCSSSLTAIHLACESIWNGETNMALAGGVNVTIHPDKYAFLSAQRFASSEGLCRAFGEGGDGYVPSEGVGAVLLKPLAQAEKDGDLIYCVIKGSAMGHGGKTNGYTVPNPVEQERVIKEALNKSKVDPKTITYVEAHGTGTSLGDPIEISGLTKAFGNDKNHYCPIGSVKSNIGHCEGAAGIASVTKVVMQMKHQKLVPSIHSDILNSKINFNNTPFYVQREVSEWAHPMRAGVSSFGAGGSNVHLVMEEYIPEQSLFVASNDNMPCIIVLSAISGERLKAVATEAVKYLNNISKDADNENNQISKFEEALVAVIEKVLNLPENSVDLDDKIEDHGVDLRDLTKISEAISSFFTIEYSEEVIMKTGTFRMFAKMLYDDVNKDVGSVKKQYNVNIKDLAYTLQIGRKHYKERMALVVDNITELIMKLNKYIHENEISDGMFVSTNIENEWKRILFDDEEGELYLKVIVDNKKYDKIAQLWTMGIDFNWGLLYDNLSVEQKPHKVSAFKYPFAKERYWVPNRDENNQKVYIGNKLSPLIDVNVSELGRISFRKNYSEADVDIYINHKTSNYGVFQSIMLGMVLDAAILANSCQEFCGLGNVEFYSEPLPDKTSFDMIVNIYDDENDVAFEVCIDDYKHEPQVYAQGSIFYNEDQVIVSDVYDIEKLKKELLLCSKASSTYKKLYQSLQWFYPDNDSLGNLYYDENSVLIDLNDLKLPDEKNGMVQFIIDVVAAFWSENKMNAVCNIEYLSEITCYSMLSQTKYIFITKEENYSVFLVEKNGEVAAIMRDFDIKIEDKASEERVLEILENLKSNQLSLNDAEKQLLTQFRINEE